MSAREARGYREPAREAEPSLEPPRSAGIVASSRLALAVHAEGIVCSLLTFGIGAVLATVLRSGVLGVVAALVSVGTTFTAVHRWRKLSRTPTVLARGHVSLERGRWSFVDARGRAHRIYASSPEIEPRLRAGLAMARIAPSEHAVIALRMATLGHAQECAAIQSAIDREMDVTAVERDRLAAGEIPVRLRRRANLRFVASMAPVLVVLLCVGIVRVLGDVEMAVRLFSVGASMLLAVFTLPPRVSSRSRVCERIGPVYRVLPLHGAGRARIEICGQIFVGRCLSHGVVMSGERVRAFHTDDGDLLALEIVDAVELDDAYPPATYARQMDELRARFH